FVTGRELIENAESSAILPQRFIEFEQATVAIGHDGRGFAYDNEGPRHQALVPAFSIGSRPVTNGEYIAFIEDNGYTRSEFWLSLGWMTVNEQRWQAPLYWTKHDGAWWNFTLSGFRPVNKSEPVTHVSYFEADAYANWARVLLPTEFEWERAGSLQASDSHAIHNDLVGRDRRARRFQRENDRRFLNRSAANFHV